LLDAFAKKLPQAGQPWRQLTEEAIGQLVEDCAADLLRRLAASPFFNTARNRYMLDKMRRIAKKSLAALAAHISRGDFEPVATEYLFGFPDNGLQISLEDGRLLELAGKIDRVDVMERDGKRYVKILDYKSGATKFDREEVALGLQLQLPLYLEAALEEDTVPGGFFYFYLHDPIVEYGPGDPGAETQRPYKLSGVVLAEEAVVRGMDRDINGWSDIIPARTKKGGGFASGVATQLTLEELNALRATAVKKAKAMAQDILAGRVDPSPFKKGSRTGCDYCGFGAICQRRRR
jgi:ATP-dependent helicase/nuclease subunit B